ncbi:MAG: hypothetical protein IJ723_01990 [Ruminococcus sp.]|nr:hypothetical protein [Ruminococcus sp.]
MLKMKKTLAVLSAAVMSLGTAAAPVSSISAVLPGAVAVSADKSFKKGVKTVWVKNNKTFTKSVGKLQSKKKYFVRFRAYLTLDGKKYYGKYSTVKKVACK